MTWATGTMVAMTLAMMPAKGVVGMLAGCGGGLLAENVVAAAAAAAAAALAAAMAAAAAVVAYCRGPLLSNVKIFLCGIFMMCGGKWQGYTSPHTLIMLEVCSHTLG